MYIELQCDGLVGPTHHYAGLSHGNVASEANAQSISYPKQAALQGLEKMRFVHEMGIPVLIIPPHPRPNLALLRNLGFAGSDEAVVAQTGKADMRLLSAAFSASSMWAANMATVSPAPDTSDKKLHFTPANLVNTLHRAQEAEFTYSLLQQIFKNLPDCLIHPPLAATYALADEGAANHLRLSAQHGAPGVEIFIYGRAKGSDAPKKYPARQTKPASEAIARRHRLESQHTVFVQQNPAAIDAGVFHNDVIAMSNENVLIYHEDAFVDTDAVLEEVRRKLAPAALVALKIAAADLPLAEAVKSYFFNSQLLSLPGGGMAILAPAECGESAPARKMLERIVQSADNPVSAVHYLDIRESMRNGGGPACLRLRVALPEAHLAFLPEACIYSEEKHKELKKIIDSYYPHSISAAGFLETGMLTRLKATYKALYECLSLAEI